MVNHVGGGGVGRIRMVNTIHLAGPAGSYNSQPDLELENNSRKPRDLVGKLS
jgi:hypothetical protein